MDAALSDTTLRLAGMAPAKLNLFLHVIGRRADGLHLLQSVFVLIDLADTIGCVRREDGLIRRLTALAEVKEEDDLVVRAARLLKRMAGETVEKSSLGADISVAKKIPIGGGLGGGSSDAATTLLVLNRLWNLDFSREKLQTIGLMLGADVPFFIFGCDAFAEGVGEELFAVPIPQWWYLVLTPPAQISTQVVFRHAELTRNTFPLKILDFSANGLKDLRNDLQPVVLKEFPAVFRSLEALQAVSEKSVFGARLTGSGACVFGAFEIEQDARDALQALPPQHKGFIARGLSTHPFC